MSQAESWTVGRLLTWTADYLKNHGADSPRLDAEVLLAHALGCKRIELYTTFDDTPADEARAKFRALVKERAEGKPVAYLVGRREFYSLDFQVNGDVLIPRPETELLVVALLDRARAAGLNGPTIADVGTGSGILAVCAAKHLPGSRVTAVDISPAALKVAQGNATKHGVADRISFLQSDLLTAVPTDTTFDFIVSNPPYVSQAEYENLAPDVKRYEPEVALVAGPNGIEIIERLEAQARQRLGPGGWLLVEISPMIDEATRAIFADETTWRLEPTIKDLARLPRVIAAQRQA